MPNLSGVQLGALLAVLAFASLVILSQSLELKVAVDPGSFPTPIPTHTPSPTHTPVPPTATPVPTPAVGLMHFRVGVSATSTLTEADLAARRYSVNERRLQMPHCATANLDAHPAEYFWILIQPDSARLRTLVIDGIDQLGAWTDADADTGATGGVLTLGSETYHAYRTTALILCGDTARLGLGGVYVTITLVGEP